MERARGEPGDEICNLHDFLSPSCSCSWMVLGTYAAMDLVLFEDAMKHVARICRIISSPSGRGAKQQSDTEMNRCQNWYYHLMIWWDSSATYARHIPSMSCADMLCLFDSLVEATHCWSVLEVAVGRAWVVWALLGQSEKDFIDMWGYHEKIRC